MVKIESLDKLTRSTGGLQKSVNGENMVSRVVFEDRRL